MNLASSTLKKLGLQDVSLKVATTTMTGKILDNDSPGILILIIPLACSVVILYKLWPFILALAILIVAWKIWQNYQWQKWCKQVNPYFNILIKENRGYLTPVDLSLKANLTARSAKVFLERKAEEYGIPPKTIPDKGRVYYFPTASALGSIFDDSEPLSAAELEADLALNPPKSERLASKEANKTSTIGIAQLAKKQQSQVVNETLPSGTSTSSTMVVEEEDDDVEEEFTLPHDADIPENALIQAELAKRLDLNSSTVGRRKSDPDFPEWSQSKDPEGKAWAYVPETKLFVPLEEA
jgi:hypothetical protein